MNSRRYLTLLMVGCMVLSLTDILEYTHISDAFSIEAAQAPASRKKKKKSTKKKTASKAKSKKKKRTAKKTSSSSSRATAATPPVETPSNDSLTLTVNERLLSLIPPSHNPGGLRVNSVRTDSASRRAAISLNDNFTYLPINLEYIRTLEKQAKESLPDSLSDFEVELKVAGQPLTYYINTIDMLPEKFRSNKPFVKAVQPLSDVSKGMKGDVVAMWHSHGRYYKPGSDAWLWQRPLLFQSIEDTYTLGYILPYAVPMLENADAYVMLPRERDINPYEVIVDNDGIEDGNTVYSQTSYAEVNGTHNWETGEGDGFIYDLPDFRDTENPFENGTFRQVNTQKGGKTAHANWYADIPESRDYAIYVSYKSLPNSSEDARYTVNYDGGSQDFLVNQKMGGGTWIYLGTFPLEKGLDRELPVVSLSNHSDAGGNTVVTADAVKIGGGMGNISRSPKRSDVYWDNYVDSTDSASANGNVSEEDEDDEGDDEESDDAEETTDNLAEETVIADIVEGLIDKPAAPERPRPNFKTSGLPRWLEGSRYWLQWAGMPDSVYSPYGGTDDYKDDYTSRGLWVNYLAGGSRVLPNEKGLGIPVDVTMALHSDAGKRSDDSFVGTLGIYFTNGAASYADGTPRRNSRTLTDMLMRQITGDIRQAYEPEWTRRSMWDKSYVEARVPEVPTALIELLSHQNFADMQYGLDPRFRFLVGRSIYKALARFVGERKGREVVIQPLPVKNFSIHKTGKNVYRLSWLPTPDAVEPTAIPTHYIIMERSGEELGFHKVAETKHQYFDIHADDNDIHSFQVIAANDGGRSFPSETLAFRWSGNDEKPVLIVNGFTRLCAPESFSDGNRAGFEASEDFGVPYIKDVTFTGYQTEFNRNAGESFGKSSDRYIPQVIAGNTFDFAAVHGNAIMKSGRGFVSTSLAAVEDGSVNLSDYKTVDLILGKQKATTMGRGNNGVEFFAFPSRLRKALTHFLDKGGRLLVSGQYVASDLKDPRNERDAFEWGRKVLGIEVTDSVAKSLTGRIDGNPGVMKSSLGDRRYRYSNTLNEIQYIVEHPDAIQPSGEADEAEQFLIFSDTDAGAGMLVRDGKSKRVVMSIPLESLTDENQRNLLMDELLDWLEK